MRIGLLSDTHIPLDAEELPPQVKIAFRGVNLILHAGDIYVVRVLDELEKIAPVFAALGDDDGWSISTDKRVTVKHVLECEGLTLWLTHSKPCKPWHPGLSEKERERNIYGTADIIIFGHEHQVSVERNDNTLLVNPGSPTFLHYQRGLGTVAILNIKSGKAEIDILKLSDISES